MLVLVGCLVAGSAVYGVELVVLVLVSAELLGTGTSGLGLLLAASGVGGVLGATLSARFARYARPRVLIGVLVLATGFPLAALALLRAPAPAYLLMVVEGVGIDALAVLVETGLQRVVPGDALGRVSGLVLSLTSVGTAAGIFLAPGLVAWLGLPMTLVVGGLVPVTLAASSLLVVADLDALADRGRTSSSHGWPSSERLFGSSTEPRRRPWSGWPAPSSSDGSPPARSSSDRAIPPSTCSSWSRGRSSWSTTTGGGRAGSNEMVGPDYLGKIGLVQRVRRTATVTAGTDVLLRKIFPALCSSTR